MTAKKDEQQAHWFDVEPEPDWTILRRMAWVTAKLGTLEKDSTVNVGKGGRFKALSHDALVAHLNPLLARAGIYAQPVVGDCTEDQMEGSRGDSINKATAEIGYRFWCTDAEPVVLNDGGVAPWINGRDYLDVEPLLVTAYDRSDKASGKAISYGKKYVLRLAFNVATGEDVDQGDEIVPDVTQPRRKSTTPPAGDLPIPTLATEPHEFAMNISETDWRKVASEWDTSSRPISEAQRKRLYAIAHSKQGWSSDEVKQVVKHHLGVDVDQVPMRGAYDGIVEIFESNEPSKGVGFIGDDDGGLDFGPEDYS